MRRIDLAERCAALGWPALTHTALGYLETGRRGPDGVRRREITADEIVVLAAALEVPPITLVIPVGHAVDVEMLPGRMLAVDVARRWFDGSEGLDGTRPEELARLLAAREHDHLVKQLRSAVARLAEALARPADDKEVRARIRRGDVSDARRAMQAARRALDDVPEDDSEGYTEEEARALDLAKTAYDGAVEEFRAEGAAHGAVKGLLRARDAMRGVGDVPPPLPTDLAWIEGDSDAS